MKELLDRKKVILNLGFPEERFSILVSYVESLWEANQELNLFSRQMPMAELVDNHIIDCLLALPNLPHQLKTLADLGSGGGLPGVLFSIARPSQNFQLFEKSPKKRQFLSSCQKLTENLEIKSEVSVALPGIELVTARAFKPIEVILELTRGYYLRGGKYYLLKGRREKIDEELALAGKKFKNLNAKIEKIQSPVLEVERHIVTINL